MKLFTDDQEAFVRAHVKGRLNKDLTELVNLTFGLNLTVKQMKTWKKNHKMSSGLKGSNGLAPKNKGTKGLYNVGGNRTSFKKGNKPFNYLPIGSERLSKDGYILVKVQDEGPYNHRWKLKHKVLWEQVNGPVPKGHKLLFKDQDKQNISLENLMLITNRNMATLNKKDLLSSDPELNKASVSLANVFEKIQDKEKEL